MGNEIQLPGLSANSRLAVRVEVTSKGDIWFAVGDDLPQQSPCSLEEFISFQKLPRDTVIKMSGASRNSRAIVHFFSCARRGQIRAIRLASPHLIPNQASRNDPVSALMFMQRVSDGYPASLGGWHTVRLAEAASYCLAIPTGDRMFSSPSRRLMYRGHILRRHLEFIGTLSPALAARLIGILRDPRWYVDAMHPNRSGRLFSYLGIRPHIINPGKKPRHLVYRWYVASSAWRVGSADDIPSPAHDIEHPRHWLWKYYQEKGGDQKALLCATRKFVSYVKYGWLDRLTSTSSRTEALFDPEIFFNDPAVCEAYYNHISSV